MKSFRVEGKLDWQHCDVCVTGSNSKLLSKDISTKLRGRSIEVRGKEYLKSLYKYYITDIGIRNQKINYRQIEVTHTLENIIYNELLVRGYTVDIGKNQNKEIDFIARRDGSLSYIQVAYSVADADKMEQEISSFYTIADGYEKILITMDTDPFTQLKNGYKKISVYDFLLEEGGTR